MLQSSVRSTGRAKTRVLGGNQEAFMSRLKGVTVAAVVAASVVAWSGNAFAQAKIVDGPEVKWKLAAWGKPRAATQNIETLRKFMDERTGGKFKIQIGYESFGQPKELLDLAEGRQPGDDQHLRLLPSGEAAGVLGARPAVPADPGHGGAGEGPYGVLQASAGGEGVRRAGTPCRTCPRCCPTTSSSAAARHPRASTTSRACACARWPASALR